MNLTPEQIKDSSEDAKTFVLRTMENDSQFGAYLHNLVSDSGHLSEDDWKFLAASIKLSLGYSPDTLNIKRLKGNF
jgi:hypothetical protein